MSSRLRYPVLLVGAVVLASLAPSCADPVHDAEVASLGPEDPDIPPGQYHRAGQPCTWCHGPEGPAKTQFSLAGTIFWQGGATSPFANAVTGANQATVSVIDSLGSATQVTTNCVGNFYVGASDYTPAYPILVAVYGPDSPPTEAVMATQISRASSCAECHFDPPNYDTPGHVYLTAAQLSGAQQQLVTQNATSCPVDPNLGDLSSGGLPQ